MLAIGSANVHVETKGAADACTCHAFWCGVVPLYCVQHAQDGVRFTFDGRGATNFEQPCVKGTDV